jgi:hypothetical protein
MQKTKLAKAVAFALAGAALTAGSVSTASASLTTMYNLSSGDNPDNSTNTVDPVTGINSFTGVTGWNLSGTTDGWTNGVDVAGSGIAPLWAGTGVGFTTANPFGYAGAHMNWGIEITGGAGGTGTISTYDAFNRYGVYADIDTAKGAWSDNTTPPSVAGWRHDLDTGLFKSDTGGLVTLNATGIMQSGTNFGFTIFKGMDTGTGYNHHGGWNAGNNATGLTSASLPGGGTVGLTVANIVAYSVGGATPSNLNTISFNAEAGQIYQIFLGGYRNGAWGDTIDGYSLNISQSAVAAVPVPGAVWLFGTAMAGFLGLRRNKKLAA